MLCVSVCECVVEHGAKCRESTCAATISLHNVSSSFVLSSSRMQQRQQQNSTNKTLIQTTHSQTHTYSSTFVVYRIGRFFSYAVFFSLRATTKRRDCNRYIQCERISRQICTKSASLLLDLFCMSFAYHKWKI